MLKCMLIGKSVSILLDSDAIESFISSYLLHSLPIRTKPLEESWKVEFALGKKSKVTKFLEDVILNLLDFQSKFHLYVVPLPAYDIILGVDWLNQNKTLINFKEHWAQVTRVDGSKTIFHSLNKSFQLHPLTMVQVK